MTQDEIQAVAEDLVDKHHPWCQWLKSKRVSLPATSLRSIQVIMGELLKAGCIRQPNGEKRGWVITRRGSFALQKLEPTLRGDCAHPSS
jgi:hypothetical protein